MSGVTMTAIDKIAKLPTPEAMLVGEQIEELQFKFRYFENYPTPDAMRRVQVRDIREKAPVLEANAYAVAYERGDRIPPIVVTTDGYVVDGATRTAGAVKAKLKTMPVFVVNAAWETAPPLTKKRLKQLGMAFNGTHGKAMKADNIQKLIAETWEEGMSAAQLAVRLHCPESTVQGVMAGVRGMERARRLGITGLDDIGVSHMKTLGAKVGLKDPSWKALTELSRDASLTVPEIASIAGDLRRCTTEQEELKLIAQERAARPDQIKRITRSPGLPGKIRRGISQVLVAEGCEDSAVEWDPEAAELLLGSLLRARGVIDKMITEQRAVTRNGAAPIPHFNPGQ